MLCQQEPLRWALAMPRIQTRSSTELLRSRTLHAAFWALHAFRQQRGRLPQPRAPVSCFPAPPPQPVPPHCTAIAPLPAGGR